LKKCGDINAKGAIIMKEVAIESLMADVILQFCENAAELGCPRDKEVDMWFRYLEPAEQFAVCDKLLTIMERNIAKIDDENKKSKNKKSKGKKQKKGGKNARQRN
jgi:hypothetical protein